MLALKEVGLSGRGRRPWGHPGGTSSSFSPGSLLPQSCRHTAIFYHLRCHCLKVKSQVLTVSLELTFPAVTVSMPGGQGRPLSPANREGRATFFYQMSGQDTVDQKFCPSEPWGVWPASHQSIRNPAAPAGRARPGLLHDQRPRRGLPRGKQWPAFTNRFFLR